ALPWRGCEGEFVAALGLVQGTLNQAGDVIAAVQHQAAALLGHNLQAELPESDVVRLARRVQKGFVKTCLPDILRGADRIYGIDNDTQAAEFGRELHDV